jgi:hypothetical protein
MDGVERQGLRMDFISCKLKMMNSVNSFEKVVDFVCIFVESCSITINVG